MATKRKQERTKNKPSGTMLPPRDHNVPEPTLTRDERTVVENAKTAMQSLRKSFEFWIAIARGLKALEDKAALIDSGRFTFDWLRTREGLGPDVLEKSRVSKLRKILERLDEVEKWRQTTLTDLQQLRWASPEAVMQHCPIFKPVKPKVKKPKAAKPAPQPQPEPEAEAPEAPIEAGAETPIIDAPEAPINTEVALDDLETEVLGKVALDLDNTLESLILASGLEALIKALDNEEVYDLFKKAIKARGGEVRKSSGKKPKKAPEAQTGVSPSE